MQHIKNSTEEEGTKAGSSKVRGFTLVEMLVVIGLIAMLSTVVLVAVNPARQFQSARDATRHAHLSAILNAIGQNITEHQGTFMCQGQAFVIPVASTPIGTAPGNVNLESCLVPTYLATMPQDPSSGPYQIVQDPQGHISVMSQSEINPVSLITLTR